MVSLPRNRPKVPQSLHVGYVRRRAHVRKRIEESPVTPTERSAIVKNVTNDIMRG